MQQHNSLLRRLPINALRLTALLAIVGCWPAATTCRPAFGQDQTASKQLVSRIVALSNRDVDPAQRRQLREQTYRNLRRLGDGVNRQDLASWRSVGTVEDWERLRDQRLKRLADHLRLDRSRMQKPEIHVASQISGEGYTIQNIVFQSRPGLWVTANLYGPPRAGKAMPGLLLVHSHHRPKTQEELQDMGMTWARKGCLVLVIDQLGHGERADHPFRSAADYKRKDSGYRWWRQDYYYRFDIGVQLDLLGESLMGWMAWDLMQAVDVLRAQPGIDRGKIVILGAVAGGGDPCAVTAALDPRIAAAVPFNFGGPQPETRFPLPQDAELHFNYLGGASWEGTRNLRRTGSDEFLHWTIVAGIAPRPLIYAHEFAWDEQRDPVWKRLQRIYGFYNARDKLDYTKGRGSVRGKPPEATHCTNIGAFHRQRIHAALSRWFDIKVTPEEEYRNRRKPEELRSMTEQLRQKLKPQPLFALADKLCQQRIHTARTSVTTLEPARRRIEMQNRWRRILGKIDPLQDPQVVSSVQIKLGAGDEQTGVIAHQVMLRTEPDILVPLVLMRPAKLERPKGVVIAVSQSGDERFLRDRANSIGRLLQGGMAVCLPAVRGAGTDRGSRGGGGSTSAYALFFETPMVGYRLRDLRSVMKYLRGRSELRGCQFGLWGDSFAPPNPQTTNFQVPKRVDGRPRFSEPLGALLAMLGALFEDNVRVVFARGGLINYREALAGPYIYIPHDVVIPDLFSTGDLADLAMVLAPRPLRLDGLVDGLNRTLDPATAAVRYQGVRQAYFKAFDNGHLTISNQQSTAAQWILAKWQ